MKATYFVLTLAVISMAAGCGGDDGQETAVNPPATPAVTSVNPAPPAAMVAPVNPVVPPPSAGGNVAAATMPAAQKDPLASFKTPSEDGKVPSTLEALQAAVDAYAFGSDGLGAPPLNSLDELVTKGVLKRLPTPPDGMQWAYDSAKWKVSLVSK